jgi:DNA helicase-2/ATP-dependent DNA helicase PcrA
MSWFIENKYELNIPYRRIKWNNEWLGTDIKAIRESLIKWNPVSLSVYSNINYTITDDIYSKSMRKKVMWLLSSNASILVIDPNSTTLNSRILFVQRFRWICSIIEAIDDKDFYKISKLIDNLTNKKEGVSKKDIFDFLCKIFWKTELKKRIKENGVINKKGLNNKEICNKLIISYDLFCWTKWINYLWDLLTLISKINWIKFYRRDLYYTLLNAIRESYKESTTVLESMKKRRNSLRRVWRKVTWRSIWTTLLTKWLEFEVVIIINADRFKCEKNFYVAISRATTELHIFSAKETLNFE